jgi:hypothetical protein
MKLGTSLQLGVVDLSLFVGVLVASACIYGRLTPKAEAAPRGNRCTFNYRKVEGFR